MWAVATHDLGLTTAQFWQLTPRKYQALLDRHAEAENHKTDRTKLLGFYMYNAMGAKKENGQSFTPRDFGLEDGSADTSKMPTLEEFVMREKMGEEMLKARAEGKPNPFAPEPNDEALKVNAADVLKG